MMELNSRDNTDMDLSVSECQKSGSLSSSLCQKTHVNEHTQCVCDPYNSPVIAPTDEIDGFITEITQTMDDLWKTNEVNSNQEVKGKSSVSLCNSNKELEESENEGNMKGNIVISHAGQKCACRFITNDNFINTIDEQQCTCRDEYFTMCASNELKKNPIISVSQSIHTDLGVSCIENGEGYVNEKRCDRVISKDEKEISMWENTPIKKELTDFDDTNLNEEGVIETDLGYYWLTSTIEEKSEGSVISPSDISMEDVSLKKGNVHSELGSEKFCDKLTTRNSSCDEEISSENSVILSNSDCSNMEQNAASRKSRKSVSDINSMARASEILSSFEPKFLSLDRAVLGKKRISCDDSHLKAVSDENLKVKPLRRKYSAPPSFCKVYRVISIDIPKMDSYVTLDKSGGNTRRRNSSELRKRGSFSGASRKGSLSSVTTIDSLNSKKDKLACDKEDRDDKVVNASNDGLDIQAVPSATEGKGEELVNHGNKDKKVKVPEVDTGKTYQINWVGNGKGDDVCNGSIKSGKQGQSNVKQLVPGNEYQDICTMSKLPALVMDNEEKIEIQNGPILEPPPEFVGGKDAVLANLNMQSMMVWDPGVPKVPPRTYLNKQGHLNKKLPQTPPPPPPSPRKTEQLITNMLNGHVMDLNQEKAPPLPERRRIVNTASVKKIDNKLDRNTSDQVVCRKQHDIKGISRTNLKDKHKKMVNRLSGSHSVISSLMEKRNTRDMLEVLDSYKFVENFYQSKDTSGIETVNNKPNFKSMATNTKDSLDRRKSKSYKKSAIKDFEEVVTVSENKDQMNAHARHLQRKLVDKPQSYSEGMENKFEPSAHFQVHSLNPVLLKRNNSSKSVRNHAGSVETSPESTPDVSPRTNHDNNIKDTLNLPKGQQDSLFIDPEMARTWHGTTSLNWSKQNRNKMKVMMKEFDSLGDSDLEPCSHEDKREDSNFEMGSKTLPSKSLLDQMHTRFCSDQYHNLQESNEAKELVLLKLKSQPTVKPKRTQSFNIRMGTRKSSNSLNSNGSPLLQRVQKRVGIKTRPDFQYSPKPPRAREGTPDGLSRIPDIKIPECKREEAEIEAIEACRWLRETGFPQYAQLYEDGQFPVDIDSVEKDHDFLDKEDIQSLFRRLNTLNKCAIMKIGTPTKKETEDSDEEDQCALSDKWKYQRSSRRWSRKDLETPMIEHKNSQPVLRSASSHDSLLADQNSSSETGDSPELVSKMHHINDDMVFLKTSSPLDANGNATTHMGSKVFHRAASEKIKGAKGLLKRMESLKIKRSRKPKTITEISEPVPTNHADMQEKIKHLNCKEINTFSANKSSQSELSHQSTNNDTSQTIGDTLHSISDDSVLNGLDYSANNTNSLVNGNESVRVTSPDNRDEDSSSTSTSATPSLSENVMELSTSSNGALGLDLSPISRRSNSSETTSSSEDTLFLSSDYKPGKFPTILDDSLFSTDRNIRARSVSYTDDSSASPDLRHARRGSHDPRKKLHRVSIYDNVPIEEDLQMAKDELDIILSELFQNINGLNKAINGESAELLEPPTFTSFDDTSLSIDSQTPGNEPIIDPSNDFTQDENEVISGTLSSPDISDHEHTEDMSHDDSVEQIECRERRDSGVGSSLTRTNSDRRKYRIRWHSFQKSHRPTSENRNLQMSCVSAGQIMVLRKLSLLKLTALIEKYSPNRSGWSLSVPRFMKRHKVPDYKDKNVFGIPFNVMIQRTGQALPQCILHAMRFLRRTSGDNVGIFRKSGVRSRIQKLRNDIEANAEMIEYEEQQSYDLADLVKQFFRELPECLLTNKLSDIFISIFIYVPVEFRLEALQAAVILMADENRDVLWSLLLFLSDIAKYHNKHQMTASNLAVCFAPSLFNMGGLRHPSQTPSPRRTRKNVGIPDARELMEQKAAHECLTVMIQECKRIFTIPAATLAKCRFRHGDPVTLDQLNGGGLNDDNQGYTSYIDSCIQGLLKESREKFRGWVSVSVHNDVDVSYKKVGDGHPLRLWKCTVDIEAPPTEVLNRVLHDRQQWDEDLLQWNTVHKLDEETEVFQYVRNTMAPHPTRDFCVLRSWRSNLPKGACVLISTSIEHPETELQGGIRAVELASRYLIEPCGTGKSRLTHISRVDMRGHSPDWYKKVYGHICANFMGKICASFKCKTDGPETKV